MLNGAPMERDARLQILLLKPPVDDELNMVSPSKVLFMIIWNSNCNSKSEYAVLKLVAFDLVEEVSFIAPQEKKKSSGVKSGDLAGQAVGAPLSVLPQSIV